MYAGVYMGITMGVLGSIRTINQQEIYLTVFILLIVAFHVLKKQKKTQMQR